MSNFVPENVFLRGVLLHYFNMKKTAAESHRILVEVYAEHALAERTCQKWFARFKSSDFGLEDVERPHWNTVHIRTGYQKLAQFILGREAGAVLLGWNPQIARKMGKSHSFRWAIL